jgi:hypothetical protein
MGRGRRTGRGSRYIRDGGVRKESLTTNRFVLVRVVMKHLVALLLALTSGPDAVDSRPSITETPHRPIIWHSWQDQAEYRVRAGDRYLGRGRWEYYLGFEERPSISKEIKISMIHFVKQPVPDVLLAPGRRYGIVEVTNSTMSAYKVYWSWVARDVPPSAALPDAYPW